MADSSHESYLDHVTYNDDETAKPGRVLELDVHVKPRGDVDQVLALYSEGKSIHQTYSI